MHHANHDRAGWRRIGATAVHLAVAAGCCAAGIWLDSVALDVAAAHGAVSAAAQATRHGSGRRLAHALTAQSTRRARSIGLAAGVVAVLLSCYLAAASVHRLTHPIRPNSALLAWVAAAFVATVFALALAPGLRGRRGRRLDDWLLVAMPFALPLAAAEAVHAGAGSDADGLAALALMALLCVRLCRLALSVFAATH